MRTTGKRENTNVLGIVQARSSSTRLPGKVLRTIQGQPLLQRMLHRLKRCRKIDRLLVAIPDGSADDPLHRFLKRFRIPVFRGSESDVLDRFYQASKAIRPKHLIRFTADSPLIDPFEVDRLIAFYLKNQRRLDYATFGLSYPEGQNSEIFSWKSFEEAWKTARLASEREHVSAYIWKRPRKFSVHRLELPRKFDHLRWTVDEPEDIRLVRILVRRLGDRNGHPTMGEIITFLERHPRLAAINNRILRNEGYAISRKRDRDLPKSA